jgi:DNA-binding transcriptional regulator YhcF (GntR family)
MMNKYEKERLRQAYLYKRRKILIQAGFTTGSDKEIYELLQSGLKKILEKIKKEGYTLEELVQCLQELEKFN